MKDKKNLLFIVLYALVVIIIFASIYFIGKKKQNEETVGFVMTGKIGENGWNENHYEGIRNACEDLGVNLLIRDNIGEAEGEYSKAVEDLIDDGANMIVINNYQYADEVEEVIKKHPEIEFYTNSFEVRADNVTSYFYRIYQARYLSGIVAGLMTEKNQIGYVAAMPTSEVNRGISAFTLGVKRVNPDATVTVIWTNSWDNEAVEREKTRVLIDKVGVDLVTYQQNYAYVIDEAEKAGIYSIGCYQRPEGVSDKCLTTVTADWKLAYTYIVKQSMRGRTSSDKTYWVGLEQNTVGLTKYSPLVSENIQTEVTKAKNEILGGKAVFSGIIYDNQGNLRCHENEMIRDDFLLEQFDWYVEGVEIYEE